MAEPRGFQYASPAHEAETAACGMWLFLGSEMLFFGGLVYVWVVLRMTHPAGVALGAAHTNLLIGSLNTLLLLTSSLAMTIGVLWAQAGGAQAGRGRAVAWACIAAALLGAAFLVLKGVEWALDFHEGLFPGPGFAPDGPDAGGARLFFSLYFVATALHGAHMLVGLGLLAWVARRCWRRGLSVRAVTAVEVVGLYWSFVDTVWLVLYPLLYVVARP